MPPRAKKAGGDPAAARLRRQQQQQLQRMMAEKDMDKKQLRKVRKQQESERRERQSQRGKARAQAQKRAGHVVYVGHLPQEFEEGALRRFCRQFGVVSRLKLWRSAQSGRSRGFAFVDFRATEDARIAAETLQGYYVADRQLVANVVPKSKMHEGMFLPPRAEQRELPQRKQQPEEEEDAEAEAEAEAGTALSREQAQKRLTKLRGRQAAKRKRLAEAGIDFEVPDLLGDPPRRQVSVATPGSGDEGDEDAKVQEQEDEAEEEEEQQQASRPAKKKKRVAAKTKTSGSSRKRASFK